MASTHSEKNALVDYYVIITSSAANQNQEFLIITYVIILTTVKIFYHIFKTENIVK